MEGARCLGIQSGTGRAEARLRLFGTVRPSHLDEGDCVRELSPGQPSQLAHGPPNMFARSLIPHPASVCEACKLTSCGAAVMNAFGCD